MPEKKGIIKRVTEYIQGDREPGEVAPADDGHIKGAPHQYLPPDDGGAVAEPPSDGKDKSGEEQEYQIEIAGVERKVDQKTYDLVMADRAAQVGEPEPEPETPAEPTEEEKTAEVTDFYSDPMGMLRKFKDEAVRDATTISGQAYAADKAQNDFWTSFYGENPLLREEQMLVKMVLAQNAKSLRGLEKRAGRDKLAELVETEILRISNKHIGRKKEPDETSTLEGGNVTAPVTTEESDNLADKTPLQRPPSIGDTLKARRLKRERAKRGEAQTELS